MCIRDSVSLDHKYGTVRKTFAETALVKVECGYGRAADSHFAGYLPYQPFDVPCLVRNPVSGIALYQAVSYTHLDVYKRQIRYVTGISQERLLIPS